MPRKCGLCHQRILDEAQARYKQLDPGRYILRYLQNGCGLPGCPQDQQGTWAFLVDGSVEYVRLSQKNLAANPIKATWNAYFLLQDTASLPLPSRVTIRRIRCLGQNFQDCEPRWMNGSTPRYVARRPSCNTCGKGANWCPVDPDIRWVDPSKLSRKWGALSKSRVFDPADVLKHPNWYLPATEK